LKTPTEQKAILAQYVPAMEIIHRNKDGVMAKLELGLTVRVGLPLPCMAEPGERIAFFNEVNEGYVPRAVNTGDWIVDGDRLRIPGDGSKLESGSSRILWMRG
jgi:hypothetical protein